MRISIAGKLYVAAGAIFCGVVLIGAWLQHGLFPRLLGLVGHDGHLFLTKVLFDVGGKPVRVFFLIKTFLFLVFLVLLSRLSRYVIQRIVRRNPSFGEHRGYILSRVVSFLIYIVGIFIGIHVERISLGTFLILGGTLGVGVGLGLQSLLSNLIAGFILLIEQPIRIGDRIEFGDKTGEVVQVGSRSSWIRTYDNATLIIPNSQFVNKEILNWTVSDPRIQVAIPVSVAYGSDSERVMQILLELGSGHADVLKLPAPAVLLADLGANALTFTLNLWTTIPANHRAQLRSDIYLQVLRRFKLEKIELPFAQLDLHVKSIDASVPVSRRG